MTDRRPTAVALAGLLIAAALAAAACAGSTATPPIVYVTPSPSLTQAATATSAGPGITSAPLATPTDLPAGATWPAAPTLVDTVLSEGGSTASCSTWVITLHKPIATGIPSAGALNAAISTVVDGYASDFKSKIAGASGSGPCTLEGDFTVGIATQAVVGVVFTNQVQLGGATTTTVGSLNFSAVTGKSIALADLFADRAGAATILSTQSRALLKAALSITADQSLIAAGTGPDLANFDGAWVLTPTGVQLTFAVGQVGPASLGTPTITVPWSALSTVIDPGGPAETFVAPPSTSPASSPSST